MQIAKCQSTCGPIKPILHLEFSILHFDFRGWAPTAKLLVRHAFGYRRAHRGCT